MRLLLFLTALLTGFSGAAAAERAADRVQIERADLGAVVHLLDQARIMPAAHVHLIDRHMPAAAAISASDDNTAPDSSRMASLAPVNERRLE